MNRTVTQNAPIGAINLLEHCLDARAGQTLLIVGEEGPEAHFDRALCDQVARAAGERGIDARVVIAPVTSTASEIPSDLAKAIVEADHTVFFARMADQIRFLGIEGGRSMFACYVLDPDLLDDPFTGVDHRFFQGVHDLLVEQIEQSATFRIQCPDGTDLSGETRLSPDEGGLEEFAVKPFPIVIFPPIDASRMSGRIALVNQLTSSSTNIYEDSVFMPRSRVMATVENGRLVSFEGEPTEAARVSAHFERVGAMTGGDPFAINSWHAGINPLTHCAFDPKEDTERWGTAAFGSPRYTHFHACGPEPGDIAINLFDTTITFDDAVLWRDGRFVFMERPEVRALQETYPGSGVAWNMRWDIGVARRNAG
jgi:hypothetical protein